MHTMQMYCDNRREPKVGMLYEGVLMMGVVGGLQSEPTFWGQLMRWLWEGKNWRFPVYCDGKVNYQLAFSSGTLHLSRGEIAVRVRIYITRTTAQ